jgi:hypothetical protein
VTQHWTLALASPAAAVLERPALRLFDRSARLLTILGLASAGFLPACRSGDVSDGSPAAAAGGSTARVIAAPDVAAGGAPVAHPGRAASDGKAPFASKPWHIPVGPTLTITPGKGFGPIRFGAHLDTIERLIGEPCEDKRQEGSKLTCRYSAQAVDFVLEDGSLTQMRGHRLGRPFNPDGKLEYGIFNGHFESGAAFGMLDRGARELLGAPKAVRNVQGDNPNHTVEEHDYDGFTLEFDRISPESVVLGGVIMNAPAGGAPPGAATPAPAAPAPKASTQAKPPRAPRPLH